MDELYEWNPWENTEENKNLLPEITEPPCKYCEDWKPQRHFTEKGKYDKMICCISDAIYPDFACFSPDSDKINNNKE